MFCCLSSKIIIHSCPFDHLLDSLKVIPLHFQVAHPAITLRCFDAAMAQKILDGDQVRIGIEQLGGHGVAQLVAGYRQACFFGIILHAFLDPSYR